MRGRSGASEVKVAKDEYTIKQANHFYVVRTEQVLAALSWGWTAGWLVDWWPPCSFRGAIRPWPVAPMPACV